MKQAANNIGMASAGQDTTVNELEATLAEMTGKEKALYLPTTTIGTTSAMQSLDLNGKQIVMESRCHIYWVEQFHTSQYAGAAPVLVEGDKFGAMSLGEIQDVIDRSYYGYELDTGLICLENTHNVCGGTYLTADYTRQVAELAHGNGIPLFLDGARVFNAAVAQNISVRELTDPADVVVLSLNKGLLAPVGGGLCGSADLIEKVRTIAKRSGTIAIHKGGILAGAALVGLNNVLPQLGEDHARARRLAERLCQLDGVMIDLETVQTNFVLVDTSPSGLSAVEFAERLAVHGLAVHIMRRDAFKMVTYQGISDEHVDQAVDIFGKVLDEIA